MRLNRSFDSPKGGSNVDKIIPKEEWVMAFVMLSYMQDTSRVPLQAAHIVEKSTAREDRILRLNHK